MTVNPLESPVKQRMKRAHTLIKAKKFAEARDLLEGLENPTARKWMAKLDDILMAQDDPFDDHDPEPTPQPESDPDLEHELSRSVQIPRRKTQSSNAGMWTMILAISVVVMAAALFLVFVYLPGQDNKQSLTKDLENFCEFLLGGFEMEGVEDFEMFMDCEQFAEEAMVEIEKEGVVDEVKGCFDKYPMESEEDLFNMFPLMACLETEAGDVSLE